MDQGKPIKPQGTAAQRVAAQKAAQQEQPGTVQRKTFEQMTQAEQEAILAARDAAMQNVAPQVRMQQPAPYVSTKWNHNDDWIAFRLKDGTGRVIQMGPPSGEPADLVIPQMQFGINIATTTMLELEQKMRVARIMQYVRTIDGVRLPDPIWQWLEVCSWVRALGELGYRAVKQKWEMNWSDEGGDLWEDIKSDGDESRVQGVRHADPLGNEPGYSVQTDA